MKPLPKVLFLNHSVRDGGPGKSLFYILKYLDREKLNPYVLVPKADVFSEKLKSEGIYENIVIDKRFPENLKRPRLSADTDNQAKNGGSGILSGGLMKFVSVVLNLLDLISLVITSPYFIKKNGINVIYCNGTQAKIVGALMGLVSRCPVIWHVRNIQQTRVLGTIIYTLARLPDVKRIICVSEATANQFPYAKDKLRVIHNGIDEEEYAPSNTVGDLRRDYGIPARTIVVGSTGRIVPRKGYPLFIEAAHTVLKKTADKNKRIKFVIVGDTPYFFQDDHL
ncbi:glycosyltransferase family 4 protein, partial [candidate division KSB1 bacterium]|nr:glycosyltransferase family 4 protein [candidate division KSB1 bacterium]